MKLAVWAALISLAAAVDPPYCWGSCVVDANCQDSIHGVGVNYGQRAKCCGGTCVLTSNSNVFLSDRLIGEKCSATSGLLNNYEQCGGTCGGGLFCSPDTKRCHAKHGTGCNCTVNADCVNQNCQLPNITGATQTICRAYRTLQRTQACTADDECATLTCRNNQCVGLNAGDVCSGTTNAYYPGVCYPNPCRYNNTFPYGYFCFGLCPKDQNLCCSYNGDCVQGLVCGANATCIDPPPPAPLPGLDEVCTSSCQNTAHICVNTCNGTGMYPCQYPSPTTCQVAYSRTEGQRCYYQGSYQQCATGLSCNSSYYCYTQPAYYSITLGQPCPGPAAYLLCKPPGNMCQQTGSIPTPSYVCKANGTTAADLACDIDQGNTGLEECVATYECSPSTAGTCKKQKPVLSPCLLSESPNCEGGVQNCVVSNHAATCSCYNVGCCFCTAPKTVPNGGECNSTVQCSGVDSTCVTNGTCAPVVGRDCEVRSDCGSQYVQGGYKYDCGCNRKCYLLNAPTPVPAPSPVAPSPPTPQTCAAQQAAWGAVEPVGWNWYSADGYVIYDNFESYIVPRFYALSQADQGLLLDFVCCYTCTRVYNPRRFNVPLNGGHQIDCKLKTLVNLTDSCNDDRRALGILNCWPGALSSASTASFGFAALLVAALFF